MKPQAIALFATIAASLGLLVFGQSQSKQSAAEQTVLAQKQKKNTKKTKGKTKSGGKKNTKKVNLRRQTVPNADFVKAMLDSARQQGAQVLSVGDSYDDFVSIAQDSEGTLYAAYAAYYNGHDQIRLHSRLPNGGWSTHSPVPLVQGRGDIWMPQLAVDAQDRLWVIWAEQVPQDATRIPRDATRTPRDATRGLNGNWDLYARPRKGDQWGKLVRLTNDPKPDINPHVTVDDNRNIHVVWQAHPENNGDVQYCVFNGKTWSNPLAVTSDAESDWYPRAAAGKNGTVWIAFDSYRNGDYDVFLTSVQNGKLGKVIPIATSSFYEAHASVAVTRDGNVWVAWEQGGYNWGKDQGYWLRRNNANRGTALGSTRTVKVAAFDGARVLAAPDIADALPQGEQQRPTAMAELAAGKNGRLWLRFRRLTRGRRRGRRRFTKGWVENVTHLTAEGWSKAVEMPASPGRISVFSRILPAQDGSLWIAYSADARDPRNYHRPIHDHAMVYNVNSPDKAPRGFPKMEAYKAPEPPAGIPEWNSTLERKYLRAIRGYRTKIDGKEHRIIRGDLHRHTELSWDVGPGNDGSYLDFYRYMIDVAAMDFGGLTDHQGGGHYAYWWWLTEKSCDMYYLPPRYVPLYGYERSVRFPNGHRNVFHAYRGVPVFPFQLKLGQRGVFPGVGTGNVVDNDTKLLYEYLHRTGGIAISHTSGTSSMGTDWRDNDPEIEPVVEIYQGARNSYEALGAPRVHPEDEPPGRAPGGFQKAGLLWNAYKKGYRLGTIASSDHGSTHISYALVYVPKNERRAIIDAIKNRQTYGSTDTIIVELRANGRFMGTEFKTNEKPSLSIKVQGTGNIEKIDVIRNNAYVYARKPDGPSAEFQYVDMKPAEGLNMYYARVLQKNGEVAWSSPVWVNVK